MDRSTELIAVETDNITDYKKTSLLLVFPRCANKCKNCQNIHLHDAVTRQHYNTNIIALYASLNTHNAIVCAGLEPFDSFNELYNLIEDYNLSVITKKVDFVIYTGYREEEIYDKIDSLKKLCNDKINIILKLGRYIEDDKYSWHSNLLGVDLATSNQWVWNLNTNTCERYNEHKF